MQILSIPYCTKQAKNIGASKLLLLRCSNIYHITSITEPMLYNFFLLIGQRRMDFGHPLADGDLLRAVFLAYPATDAMISLGILVKEMLV